MSGLTPQGRWPLGGGLAKRSEAWVWAFLAGGALMRPAARAMSQALVCWVLLAAGGASAWSPTDPAPDAARAYLVEIDDVPVWSHAASVPLPLASLTKMMTALLVLEAWRSDDIVTANAAVAAATGSRLGLRAGDRMRLTDLLAAGGKCPRPLPVMRR